MVKGDYALYPKKILERVKLEMNTKKIFENAKVTMLLSVNSIYPASMGYAYYNERDK